MSMIFTFVAQYLEKLEYMNNKNTYSGKTAKSQIGCVCDESVLIILKRLN